MPTVHLLAVVLALLVYSLTSHASNRRRTPSAAIAWVLGLLLAPYLVLPLYLVFGWRRGPEQSPHPARISPDSHWAAALINAFGLPGPSSTWVRFHADGGQARDALWQIIEGAEHSLDVCTFLIRDDDFGRELMERLTRRARAGVRVRLLIDGAGLWLSRRPSGSALQAAGGEIRIFHPMLSLRRLGSRNLRNHRKLIVADGRRLWSGGRNLAATYFGGDRNEQCWTDLSFELSGQVVEPAAQQFARDWGADPAALPAGPTAAPPSGGTPVQYLPSGPDQPEDTVESLLLAACIRAQDRLLAVTPYFVPDAGLLAAMRLAILRGVRVTLVLPAVSNHPLADLARMRGLRQLAKAGAEVRLVPWMVHAKAFVVDDTVALSGSVNLDARSLLINYEADFVFYGEKEIHWLSHWIENLAELGQPFAAQPPGLLRDIAEGLVLSVAFEL